MPRQKPTDPNAPQRRRREQRGKLHYYLEPEQGQPLTTPYDDVGQIATEALRQNKKIVILEYAEVKIENMKLVLTPVK